MNHQTLRHEVNKFLVWRQIKRHRGNLGRADIARLTGLAESTVQIILGELKIARKQQRGTWSGNVQSLREVDRFMEEHGA